MAEQARHFGRRDLARLWSTGRGIHRVRGRTFDAANPKNIKSWSTMELGPLKRSDPALKASWDGRKTDLMYRLNWAKYRQFALLRATLVATGRAYLVENSQHDDYWGVGRRLSALELQQGPLLIIGAATRWGPS